MYAAGADIIYHAAGGSAGGLFEAAREHSENTGAKVWAIGVDSDQYNTVSEGLREFILTSMLKRVDVAVFNTLRPKTTAPSLVARLSLWCRSWRSGYSTSGGFIDDIVDQLEIYKQRVIDGELDFS